MPEIGESSHVKMEFTDILVDTVHPVKVEPTKSVKLEIEDDISDFESHVPEAEEPVRGRVTRSRSENNEDRIEPNASPEELPAEYTDGMGTTSGDIIEELTNKNEELEDRVRHLEEENQAYQEMENHYKDAAYQLQHEVDVTKTQLQRMEHSAQQIGPLIHQLVAQDTYWQDRLEQAEAEAEGFKVERDAVKEQMKVEVAERIQIEEQKEALSHELEIIQTFWDEEVERRVLAVRQRDEAMDRIHDLEDEVRDKSACAFDTAFGRWQPRIHHHPVEKGQSRRMLSRKRMSKIGDQEYHSAKKRDMLCKYMKDPNHVIESEPNLLAEYLTYEKIPVKILDKKEQILRLKVIPQVKVLWRNQGVEKMTWELETEIKSKYPHLFEMPGTSNFGDEIS